MIELITALAPYGPLGLGFACFLWREKVRDDRETKRDERMERIIDDITASMLDMKVVVSILSDRMR